MTKNAIRLEMTEGNSNKYWEVTKRKDGNYLASWGRIGTIGQTKIYSKYDIDKKIDEKLKKGYEEVSSGKINIESDVEDDDTRFDSIV